MIDSIKSTKQHSSFHDRLQWSPEPLLEHQVLNIWQSQLPLQAKLQLLTRLVEANGGKLDKYMSPNLYIASLDLDSNIRSEIDFALNKYGYNMEFTEKWLY